MSGKKEISYYIHVPFCTRKCGYCHFFVLPHKQNLVQQYLSALKREFALRAPLQKPLSIYFGGGTPSLLPPDTIAEILSWIPHDKEIEITLEANPENVTPSGMQAFKQAGINRVSIGVQSLDDSLLNALERKHGAQKAIDSVLATKASGIDNISIDLMTEIPLQQERSWERTLHSVETLPINHLSLYNLTIEPHTSFYKKKNEIEKKIPSSEASLAMLEFAVEKLQSFGLKRYEISAFAQEGFESIHNSGYWTGRPFLGFGPSAFSYIDGKRFRNTANLNRYCEALEKGIFPIDFEEELPQSAKIKELLAIRLRLIKGAPLSEFALPQETTSTIQQLITSNLLKLQRGILSLTERGMLFYDTVAEEIIEVL